MSRYELAVRKEISAKYSCSTAAIGWDGPLRTFFFSVLRNADEDDEDHNNVLCWLGTSDEEIRAIDDFLLSASKWAIIPDDIRGKLVADMANDIRAYPHPNLL